MALADIVTDPFLHSVLDTSALTRDQCNKLLEILEVNLTNATNEAALPQDVQLPLLKQQKVINTSLAQLRGLNRDAILAVRQTKQSTAEARQEVDRLHLQLQNLYYKQRHLRGEIAACEAYE